MSSILLLFPSRWLLLLYLAMFGTISRPGSETAHGLRPVARQSRGSMVVCRRDGTTSNYDMSQLLLKKWFAFERRTIIVMFLMRLVVLGEETCRGGVEGG
jgi:hypothetical protein